MRSRTWVAGDFDKPWALASSEDLARRLEAVERTLEQHDVALDAVLDAIRQILATPTTPQRRIGFRETER